MVNALVLCEKMYLLPEKMHLLLVFGLCFAFLTYRFQMRLTYVVVGALVTKNSLNLSGLLPATNS